MTEDGRNDQERDHDQRKVLEQKLPAEFIEAKNSAFLLDFLRDLLECVVVADAFELPIPLQKLQSLVRVNDLDWFADEPKAEIVQVKIQNHHSGEVDPEAAEVAPGHIDSPEVHGGNCDLRLHLLIR